MRSRYGRTAAGTAVRDRAPARLLICGQPPPACRVFRDDVSWVYLAKDLYVSYQMMKRGELDVVELASHYLRRRKARAVFAADDLRPALASLAYLRSRI